MMMYSQTLDKHGEIHTCKEDLVTCVKSQRSKCNSQGSNESKGLLPSSVRFAKIFGSQKGKDELGARADCDQHSFLQPG